MGRKGTVYGTDFIVEDDGAPSHPDPVIQEIMDTYDIDDPDDAEDFIEDYTEKG